MPSDRLLYRQVALVRLLAVSRFRLLRRQVLSETEKQAGVLTDEDVFSVVS